MMLVCKWNRQHIVRNVALGHRLRVSLETRSTRSAPIYLSPNDELEVLGEVIEQQKRLHPVPRAKAIMRACR